MSRSEVGRREGWIKAQKLRREWKRGITSSRSERASELSGSSLSGETAEVAASEGRGIRGEGGGRQGVRQP